MATLLPDEAAKVLVDSLQVAARTEDLADVKLYMRRQLSSRGLSLTALRKY